MVDQAPLFRAKVIEASQPKLIADVVRYQRCSIGQLLLGLVLCVLAALIAANVITVGHSEMERGRVETVEQRPRPATTVVDSVVVVRLDPRGDRIQAGQQAVIALQRASGARLRGTVVGVHEIRGAGALSGQLRGSPSYGVHVHIRLMVSDAGQALVIPLGTPCVLRVEVGKQRLADWLLG